MNILICDDADDAALALKKIIVFSTPNANLKIFKTGYEVLAFIRAGKKPDICFLDIIMPEMDGITLATRIREQGYDGPIVFLTTENDYAAQSYKVSAYSYLLKPPDEKEVASILQRLTRERLITDTESIPLITKSMSRYVFLKDISHVEVIRFKVYFRLTNGEEIIITAIFSEILPKLLKDRRFAQCHRSFIVNMDDISYIQGSTITMNRGNKIQISKTFAGIKKLYKNRQF